MKLILVLIFGFVTLTACANQHNELQTEIEILQEVIANLEDEIKELNARQMENLLSDEDIEAIRVDFMENAGDVISRITGLEINFDDPSDVNLSFSEHGYVWAIGHWETDALYFRGVSRRSRLRVLFRSNFEVGDEISWRIESFTFGGNFGTSNEAQRYRNYRDYLDDEYILVRFYTGWQIEEDKLFMAYEDVDVSGGNFVEEMIILTHEYFGAYVLDMQIVDNRGINRLYVNFHPSGIPSEGATSPDAHWHERLILTFTNIPDIDEVVMLMGGRDKR